MTRIALTQILFKPTHCKVGIWATQQNAEKTGQNKMGFALRSRRLKAKGFVITVEDADDNENSSDALQLTSAAWDWIEGNESQFVLKREPATASTLTDDDIPF